MVKSYRTYLSFLICQVIIFSFKVFNVLKPFFNHLISSLQKIIHFLSKCLHYITRCTQSKRYSVTEQIHGTRRVHNSTWKCGDMTQIQHAGMMQGMCTEFIQENKRLGYLKSEDIVSR